MKVKTDLGSLKPIDEKKNAALAKGRATQAYNRGEIHAGARTVAHTQADRTIGHTFHSHKGTK